MNVDIVGRFPRVRDLASGKDVVKYVMVATALVPDYVTKPQGKDEDRLEELQDQMESKDFVMPADDIPERGKLKILDPSWGDGLEEGDLALDADEHPSPETGEKGEAPKGEKGDPDPMTEEEIKKLVEDASSRSMYGMSQWWSFWSPGM